MNNRKTRLGTKDWWEEESFIRSEGGTMHVLQSPAWLSQNAGSLTDLLKRGQGRSTEGCREQVTPRVL